MKKITKISTVFLLVFLFTLGAYYSFFYKPGASFHEFKKEILSEVQEQIKFSTSKAEKAEFENMLTTLKNTQEEEKFLQILEKFSYQNLFVAFDFKNEKQQIIKELKKEISSIEDKDIQNSFLKELTDIEAQKEQEYFFEKLELLYQHIDTYYEKEGKNMKKEIFYFEDIKNTLVQELEQEVGEVQELTLKETLQNDIVELKKQNNENDFFKKSDEIYEKLDLYLFSLEEKTK